MVHSSTLTITTDGEQLMGGGFSPSEVIRLGSLEFTADHFDILSLSPEGSDSGTVFVGMAHNESPSLHAILEESVGEDDSTSSEGGSFGFPISQDCHVVISVVPIATTPPPEGTPTSLSIPMVLSWTTVPQLDTGLPPPPSGYGPIRRRSNTFYRLTSSTGLSSNGPNSAVSEQPLRPSWPNYTAARPRSR
jgi:hypothetical protein